VHSGGVSLSSLVHNTCKHTFTHFHALSRTVKHSQAKNAFTGYYFFGKRFGNWTAEFSRLTSGATSDGEQPREGTEYMSARTHTLVRAHTHECAHTHFSARTHTLVRAHTHECTHTHMSARTHTHIHTHKIGVVIWTVEFSRLTRGATSDGKQPREGTEYMRAHTHTHTHAHTYTQDWGGDLDGGV